jgi:hypothetical protein
VVLVFAGFFAAVFGITGYSIGVGLLHKHAANVAHGLRFANPRLVRRPGRVAMNSVLKGELV